MSKDLVIRVEGKEERITARSFIETVKLALGVLKELDARLSEDDASVMEWEISNVSMNSPLTMTLHPNTSKQRNDNSAVVIRTFLRGLSSVEKSATVPFNFSEEALKSTRKLVSLLNNGVARMEFSAVGEEKVAPTLHAAANIDEIISKQPVSLFEMTTIGGQLDVIDAHKGTKFIIYDFLTNSRVPCIVSDDQLELAKSALRKRVEVTGRAKMTHAGKPILLHVESIRLLRDQANLPKPTDFKGAGRIDITGGVDSADYIREMRDAE